VNFAVFKETGKKHQHLLLHVRNFVTKIQIHQSV